MKLSIDEFAKKAKLVRNTDVYSVYDLVFLRDLVASMTVLHPGKETKGHEHKGSEEVYMFLEGSGKMQLGEKKFDVKERDLVLIPDGEFHRVFNTGKKDLVFFCVFEKYEGR